jgi:hypothetical protein
MACDLSVIINEKASIVDIQFFYRMQVCKAVTNIATLFQH